MFKSVDGEICYHLFEKMRTAVVFAVNCCYSVYVCAVFILRKTDMKEILKPHIYYFNLDNLNFRYNYTH